MIELPATSVACSSDSKMLRCTISPSDNARLLWLSFSPTIPSPKIHLYNEATTKKVAIPKALTRNRWHTRQLAIVAADLIIFVFKESRPCEKVRVHSHKNQDGYIHSFSNRPQFERGENTSVALTLTAEATASASRGLPSFCPVSHPNQPRSVRTCDLGG